MNPMGRRFSYSLMALVLAALTLVGLTYYCVVIVPKQNRERRAVEMQKQQMEAILKQFRAYEEQQNRVTKPQTEEEKPTKAGAEHGLQKQTNKANP